MFGRDENGNERIFKTTVEESMQNAVKEVKVKMEERDIEKHLKEQVISTLNGYGFTINTGDCSYKIHVSEELSDKIIKMVENELTVENISPQTTDDGLFLCDNIYEEYFKNREDE